MLPDTRCKYERPIGGSALNQKEHIWKTDSVLTYCLIFKVAITGMNERERHVLFNDALNTIYLRLYGVRHMVKDHSDSEKGNPLTPHRLLLSINSTGMNE